MPTRTLIAAAAVAGAVAVSAAPADAQTLPVVVPSVASTCVVAKASGLRAPATVRITGVQLPESLLGLTGCDAAYTIVRRAATQQTPFSAAGYMCTPSMTNARVGQWTCAFQDGIANAVLKLRFTARYAK